MATIYEKYEVSCDNPRDRANVVVPGVEDNYQTCPVCGNPLPIVRKPTRVYCGLDCSRIARERSKAQNAATVGR